MIDRHECRARAAVAHETRAVEPPAPRDWGQAITAIVRHGGVWWAVSGDPVEYATSIRFCPWCAQRLRLQPRECPECGVRAGLELLYGELAGEDAEMVAAGEAFAGGGAYTPDSPWWHCVSCSHEWGSERETLDEAVRMTQGE